MLHGFHEHLFIIIIITVPGTFNRHVKLHSNEQSRKFKTIKDKERRENEKDNQGGGEGAMENMKIKSSAYIGNHNTKLIDKDEESQGWDDDCSPSSQLIFSPTSGMLTSPLTTIIYSNKSCVVLLLYIQISHVLCCYYIFK